MRENTAQPGVQPDAQTAFKLLATQRRFIMDKSRFKLGMFARQTGKTFASTLEIVNDVHDAEASGRRSPWVILSRGERQAFQAMREGIYRHAAAYGGALGKFKETEIEFYDDDNLKRKGLEVMFPKGNYIVAIPANPDTARGYSANMLFDEFAFHKDSRDIWGAAFPIISRGFKVRVISTPNGKGNKFYELATSKDPMWRKHTMDIHQAIREGAPLNADELKRGVNDDDTWDQEYLLKWLDEASSWLSYDLINSVENDRAGDPSLYAGGPCFVGVDIGLRRDLFVIWVCELVGDVLWTREIVTLKRAKFSEQDAALADVFARYRVARCCMDQTGLGEKPVEDAKDTHGSDRVEGILFSSASKLILATIGKERFEDKLIRVPEGDELLRADLHKLKKESSPTGAPRFVADSDAAGHADRAWACFLACNAAHGGVSTIEYVSDGQGAARQEELAGFLHG